MTLDERLLRLREALKSIGRRSTAPRGRLLRALMAGGGIPVTVHELRQMEGTEIDVVTVSRLLNDLFTLGLAVRFVRVNNTFAYALRNETGEDHFHHLVCERCGRCITFHRCGVEDWLKTNPSPHAFRVEYHLLTIYGVCRACQ